MHHHHSPRHSTRRKYNSSIPSPIRKHKKKFEVDEIQGEINEIKLTIFYGEHKKYGDAKT